MHRVPEKTLKIGDVITYANPRKLNTTITHRVINKYEKQNVTYYVTKGDANSTADQPITSGLVRGQAVYHMPYIGGFLNWSKKPIGLMSMIYIPALIIMITETIKLAQYYKKKQPYRLRRATVISKAENNIALPMTLFTISFILVFSFTGATVKALLHSNTVALANNHITSESANNSGILFNKVIFRCSDDNTPTASKRPLIEINNPTKQDVNITGWQIKDNNGVIVTFSSSTIIHKHKKLQVTPLLSNGLQYAGDRLGLYNTQNVLVDGLSWGSDHTYLNPAITGVGAGTRLKRVPPKKDTDTKNDWNVTGHKCAKDDDGHGHHDDGDHESDGDRDGDKGDQDEHCFDSRDETDRVHVTGMYHFLELNED